MIRRQDVVFLTLGLCVSLFIIGCRPYHQTYIDALTEFPGYLNSANQSSFQLLRQEEVAGGIVLLYAYESSDPRRVGQTCIGTTFVTQERRGGWRSQAASNLGCQIDFLMTKEFVAGYTVGGNKTDLAIAYGLAPQGKEVRIYWTDGAIIVIPIQSGTFIASRAEITHVTRIELLDKWGNTLQTEVMP